MLFGFYDYLIIGIFLFLLGGVFFMGIDKMLKVIIGNLIYIPIALSSRNLFEIIIYNLANNPPEILKNPTQIQEFISNNQGAILLVTYLLYVFLVVWNSIIGFGYIESKIKRIFMMIFLAPFAVISIFSVLGTIFYGLDFFRLEKILEITNIFDNNIIKSLIYYISIGTLLSGFALITCSLRLTLPKFNFKLNLRKKKNNQDQESGE